MTNLVNDSYNVLPKQGSSLNVSQYFYTNAPGKRGTQVGTTFHDQAAAFTSLMQGGLIQFASNADGVQYSFSAVITQVVDAHTLTLTTNQNISDTDYIIWYGGVQFDQTGVFAAQSLILGSTPFSPANYNIQQYFLASNSPTLYTPPTNSKFLQIEAVAGGGGGGSAQNQAVAVGGSGGSGGYIKIIVPSQSFTYQCGTGGSFNAGAAGSNGTNTVITGLSVGTITVNAGSGGAVATNTIGAVTAAGGAGGGPTSGITGLLSVSGQTGGYGYAYSSSETILVSAGGSTIFGFGGPSAASAVDPNATLAGANGAGYGSGGSGAGRLGTGTVANGGSGHQGLVLVTVYSS